jgi:hypothetical protein
MDLINKLLEVENAIKPLRLQVEERLNTTDWGAEIITKMNEDKTYKPIISIYEESGFKKISHLVLEEIKLRPNTELRDTLWRIHGELQKINEIQIERLKKEYLKLDSKLTPSLICMDCGYFGCNETAIEEHKCKPTTRCKQCSRDCKTYIGLQRHLDAKMCLQQHVCENCKYKTNSNNEWARHISSKKHKEAVGIVKQTYKCIPCNFQTDFQSKYKEHCNKQKHRALTN